MVKTQRTKPDPQCSLPASEKWQEVSFEALYMVPSRNGVYKTDEYHGRGCRIVNMGEMFGLDFISNQEMKRVFLSQAELSANSLKDGDLLFGRRSIVEAGAGRCALVVKPLEALTFESSIIRVRLDTARANPLFYYYFFRSPAGRKGIRRIVSGTNVKGIRGSELKQLVVPLPSPQEQYIIATVLSDVDALSTSLETLIAKKCGVKTAAMQELLTGKRRLPGFSGKWASKDFNQAFRKVGTKLNQIQTQQYAAYGSYPVVDQGQHAIVAYSDEENKVFKCPKAGVIVFGDHTRIIKFVDFDFIVGADGTQVLEVESGSCARFMYYQLLRKEIPSTGYNRHFKFLKEMEFDIPLYEEQTAIAAVLSDMDTEIATLKARRDKTQALKEGMMRQLLTGNIRLI